MTLWIRKSVFAFLGTLVLTGCDKTKEMFGMKREQPDEFTVLSRPPLSAPPGIGLKPPLPEGTGPLEKNPEKQAKETLFGNSASESKEISQSEKALLVESGADSALSTIRHDLAQDHAEKTDSSGPLDDLLYWQKKDQQGNVIDPHAEYKKAHGEGHPSRIVS
tara:strand:- start:1539 stop:2027 length:489 start_codon:yes stop_codon:yes gene_type:complete